MISTSPKAVTQILSVTHLKLKIGKLFVMKIKTEKVTLENANKG